MKNNIRKASIVLGSLVVSSFLIMTISLAFSQEVVDMVWMATYFKEGLLIFMNFVPVFIFSIIIYLIFNSLGASIGLSSLLFVGLSAVNRNKLAYRDDPFKFIELKLVREALIMVGEYSIRPNWKIVTMILFFGLAVLLIKKYLDIKIESKQFRFISLASIIIVSLLLFKPFYLSSNIYRKVGNKEKINIWVASEQFKSKGFIYPFIHSSKEARDKKPEGYSGNKAKEILSKYEYKAIPEEEKINVIAIMLEAYNDFSEFDGVNIDPLVYENFHKLKKESINGKIVTKIFAGDTIRTEREFLTGFYNEPKYYKKTNSFPWYFKEQGYRTEAMHPITGSFYNRKNVNEYLGFDYFEHMDNKYHEIPTDYLRDVDFFDFIIDGYEGSKSKNEPYFNFSVTYQNHGPYSTERLADEEYLIKEVGYDEETYNIINNYLRGIRQTDKALEKLFDYFRNEEEPTAIIIFGDHNPWLGLGDSGYEMMDIKLDLGTVEGFQNYYQTPYLIWGNNQAKSALNKELVGKGNTISPNFLMAELFSHLGWEGNEYMQYISDLKEEIDVISPVYFKENGIYSPILSIDNQNKYKEYLIVEYFYRNNFY